MGSLAERRRERDHLGRERRGEASVRCTAISPVKEQTLRAGARPQVRCCPRSCPWSCPRSCPCLSRPLSLLPRFAPWLVLIVYSVFTRRIDYLVLYNLGRHKPPSICILQHPESPGRPQVLSREPGSVGGRTLQAGLHNPGGPGPEGSTRPLPAQQ